MQQSKLGTEVTAEEETVYVDVPLLKRLFFSDIELKQESNNKIFQRCV